jgi:hypothetical protein
MLCVAIRMASRPRADRRRVDSGCSFWLPGTPTVKCRRSWREIGHSAWSRSQGKHANSLLRVTATARTTSSLCTQDSEWSRTTSYSTHARLGVVPYNELLYARETRSGPVHRVTLRTRDSEWSVHRVTLRTRDSEWSVHRVTLCTGPGVLPRPTSDSTYGGLGVVPYNTPVSVLRAPRSHRRPPVAVRNTAESFQPPRCDTPRSHNACNGLSPLESAAQTRGECLAVYNARGSGLRPRESAAQTKRLHTRAEPVGSGQHRLSANAPRRRPLPLPASPWAAVSTGSPKRIGRHYGWSTRTRGGGRLPDLRRMRQNSRTCLDTRATVRTLHRAGCHSPRVTATDRHETATFQ